MSGALLSIFAMYALWLYLLNERRRPCWARRFPVFSLCERMLYESV